MHRLRIWDLPVRLFHWLLVVCLCGSWYTAQIGFEGIRLHRWFGYATLTLILFRIAWGFCGSPWARFASFLYSPRQIWQYLKTLPAKQPARFPGHNPAGGLMVFALLALVLVQAVTGLFANDDIFFEGPLYPLVSNRVSDWLTTLHKLNVNVLLLAVIFHVAAVFFYLLRKRENLIKPMVTGRKPAAGLGQVPDRPFASNWLALLLLGLSVVTVYALVDILPRVAGT